MSFITGHAGPQYGWLNRLHGLPPVGEQQSQTVICIPRQRLRGDRDPVHHASQSGPVNTSWSLQCQEQSNGQQHPQPPHSPKKTLESRHLFYSLLFKCDYVLQPISYTFEQRREAAYRLSVSLALLTHLRMVLLMLGLMSPRSSYLGWRSEITTEGVVCF